MKKVKLGLIGCGHAVRMLYGAHFRNLEKGEFYAVMDINESRARRAQQWFGAKKIYGELGSILKDEEIDAVIIATPPFVHKDQVIKAARAGKHIFCEKPMTATIEEADEMIASCKKNKVKFMIAFMKRFNKAFCLTKKIIDEGRLGDVFEIRATWDNARAKGSSDYRHRLIAGGGFLQEDGSHALDLCRWWLGDVEQVSGNILLVASDLFETEDVANLILKHKGGGLSTLHITRLTHRRGVELYEIFGTKGTLVVDCIRHSTPSLEPPTMYIYQKSKTRIDVTPYNSFFLDEELKKNQFLRELEYFCDCILKDKEPIPGGEDGRAIVEIVNATYLSSWKGIKVKLPLQKSPDLEKIFEELRASSKWRIGKDTWWGGYYKI